MVFVVLALRKLCAAVLLLRGLSSKTPSSRDVCQRLFSGGPAHGDLQLLSSSFKHTRHASRIQNCKRKFEQRTGRNANATVAVANENALLRVIPTVACFLEKNVTVYRAFYLTFYVA